VSIGVPACQPIAASIKLKADISSKLKAQRPKLKADICSKLKAQGDGVLESLEAGRLGSREVKRKRKDVR
jgi:hypothetical protein